MQVDIKHHVRISGAKEVIHQSVLVDTLNEAETMGFRYQADLPESYTYFYRQLFVNGKLLAR